MNFISAVIIRFFEKLTAIESTPIKRKYLTGCLILAGALTAVWIKANF